MTTEASAPPIHPTANTETAPLSVAETHRLLGALRRRFADSVNTIVEQLLVVIDQQIDTQLAVCDGNEQRKRLQALQQTCRDQYNMLSLHFRDRFQKAFEANLNRAEREPEPEPQELTLVDDQTMEEDLLARNFEWQVAHQCADELVQIDRRMPVLVSEVQVHPLSPRLVITALRDACRDVFDSSELRLQLFKQFGDTAAQVFQPAYKLVSADIVAHVPEPKLRTISRPDAARTTPRTASQPAPITGQPPDAATTSGATVQQALPGTNHGNPGQVVSSILLERLDALIARHEAKRPTQTTLAFNPASGISLNLESLIQRIAPLAAEPTSNQAMHNYVRDLKAENKDGNLATTESIIVDVVAMMFDYIFDDPDIPAEIKGVIGRLQMSVLKMALTDRSFFSNKKHPARHLIDSIVEAAEGYAAGSPEGARLLEHLNLLADRIQQQEDVAAAVFERELAALEALTANEEHESQLTASRISQGIVQREDLEQRKKTVRASLLEKLAGKTIPLRISHFILNQWVEYILTLKDKRLSEDALKQQWDLLDDLIWSVTPKHSEGEQALLTRRIPDIVETVTQSLNAIGAFPHEQQTVLEALRSAHLDNLRRKKRKQKQSSPPVATEVPEFPEEPPPPPLPDALQKGALIDFREDRKTFRARLNWISPSRAKFIFTSHAVPAFGLAAAELAEELQTGRAVLVSHHSQPLMDRAVEKAINSVA